MGAPVYEVSKEFVFSAAHQSGCTAASANGCTVTTGDPRARACGVLNRIGMVVDFADLPVVVAELCARFDHRNVNEVPPFDEVNTTAENLARYFYVEANRRLRPSTAGG